MAEGTTITSGRGPHGGPAALSTRPPAATGDGGDAALVAVRRDGERAAR